MDIRKQLKELEDIRSTLMGSSLSRRLQKVITSLREKTTCKCGGCNRGCLVKG